LKLKTAKTMKTRGRAVIAIAAVILMSAGVRAESNSGGLKFGVRGGLNINTAGLHDYGAGQLTFNYKGDVGYHLGLSVRIGLISNMLHLQPEILYNFSSYRMRAEPIESMYGTLKAHTSLIGVPLLLGLELGPVHVQCGPVFNIYDNPRITDGNGNSMSDVTSKYPAVGCMAGAGISIWKLNLDVRFNTLFAEPQHRFTVAGYNVPAVKLDKSNVMIGLGLLF
jgi:hypothetical protein